MKRIMLFTALFGAFMAASCEKQPVQEEPKVLTVDRTVIDNVACQNPAPEVITITTDATNWIAKASKFITLDKETGPAGTTTVTLTIESNYKNETTNMPPRTGEVTIAGGGMSQKITVNQLGYEAPVSPNLGGITNAEELMRFADAVNLGSDLARWKDENGEIKLLADIDLTGMTWVPIGNAAIDRDGVLQNEDVKTFAGVFDGCGHKIKGLTYTPETSALVKGSSLGFFGVLYGATVKNLTVEVGRIYAECPNVILNIGGIAGAAHNGSLISNCIVTVVNEQSMIASKQVEAGTTANYIGGIVGAMNGSSVEGCTNNCPIKVNNTVNTNNGANSYHVGGIFGFGMGTLSAKNCVNNAEIGGKIGEEYWGDSPRIGGLIGTVHNDQLITIENCTNNGKVLSTIITTSDKSSRAAGIIAYIGGENSLIKGCVNNADICFISEDATGAEYKGYVAGFVGQTNKAIVIEECENYGSLLSDRWFYKEFAEGEGEYPAMGVAFSRPNKTASIVKNCKIGGKIGPYSAPDKVVTFDAGNFNLYMLGDTFAARKNVVLEGNVFASK